MAQPEPPVAAQPTGPSPSRGLSARAKDLALVKKFLVALLGLAAMAVTQGLISGTAAEWVAIGVAGATAAGVYIVPNKTLAAS